MKNQSCILAGIIALLTSVSASGHHSGAMFDPQKTIELEGTVKEFRWGNPHCWIQLLVRQDGVEKEWSIEMGSTTQLFRSGWRPGTLQQGEKVRVAVHPLRDGTPGAQFLSAQGPDGAEIGPLRKAGAS